MWYPVSVAAPATEPVTLAVIKLHQRVDSTDEDTVNTQYGKAARAFVEKYCGVRYGSRTSVALKCDAFEDFARLPEAPVTAVAITYVDTDGATQTLSTDVYELRSDDLEPSIVLKYNQVWPSIQLGSRITVTATIGYTTVPEDVGQAILYLAAHYFENREAVNIGSTVADVPMTVDALLANHRRGP